MIFLDIFAEGFLSFNHAGFILPLVAIGYWVYRRDLFSHILFLILLSIIVNSFLKCLFQVPLKAHLNQPGWYAFPSGHMQFATVLYGALWWEFRKTKWSGLFVVLLGGIGWGMIWKNYHDFRDVAGGLVVGAGLIGAYGAFIRWPLVKNRPEQVGFFLLPLTAGLIFFLSSLPRYLAHVWQAQGALLGLSTASALLQKMDRAPDVPSKWDMAFKIGVGLFGLLGLFFVRDSLFGRLGYPWAQLSSFFVAGVWLGLGVDLVVGRLKKLILKSIKECHY